MNSDWSANTKQQTNRPTNQQTRPDSLFFERRQRCLRQVYFFIDNLQRTSSPLSLTDGERKETPWQRHAVGLATLCTCVGQLMCVMLLAKCQQPTACVQMRERH